MDEEELIELRIRQAFKRGFAAGWNARNEHAVARSFDDVLSRLRSDLAAWTARAPGVIFSGGDLSSATKRNND